MSVGCHHRPIMEGLAVDGAAILTLARVQALLTSQANVGISIATIVRNEVSAQARHEEQFELSGPDILLSPKTAEVLTLPIDELAPRRAKVHGGTRDTLRLG